MLHGERVNVLMYMINFSFYVSICSHTDGDFLESMLWLLMNSFCAPVSDGCKLFAKQQLERVAQVHEGNFRHLYLKHGRVLSQVKNASAFTLNLCRCSALSTQTF